MKHKLFALFLTFFILLRNPLFSQNLDSFEYIYVDSNSGQSSGGHSAIKFGNWVYHFQYYPDKIFHLIRDPWFNFRYTYNILENRSIYLTKISPSKESVQLIERGFNRFFIVQEKHLTNLSNIKKEIQFLSFIKNNNLKKFKIPYIGYYSSTEQNSMNYESLRNRIKSKLGVNFYFNKRNELYNNLNELKINQIKFDLKNVSSTQFLKQPTLIHQKYIEVVQKLVLLSAIEKGLALKKTSLIELKNVEPSENEMILYSQFLKFLEERLIIQLQNDSQEENWGQNCLTTLSVYLTVSESLERKKFVFLDTLPTNQDVINWKMDEISKKAINENFPLFNELRNSFYEKRESIEFQDFIDLQDSANRWHEIQESNKGTRPIRNSRNLSLPMKEGEYNITISQINSIPISNSYILELNQLKDLYEKKLMDIYSYNLIYKNCTSEIFSKISEFYNHNSELIQKELGKDINPNRSLSFIPFYSNKVVRSSYKVSGTVLIPSYRKYRVNKNKSASKKWIPNFSEDFTPTSTIYEFNDTDSIFLFFTDETFAFRPLYGSVNLLTGIIQFTIGIPMVTYDQGNTLKKGWDGIFFSLPELIFFNIRKGSFYQTSISELEENFPEYKMNSLP